MRKYLAAFVCLLLSALQPAFGQTQLIVNGGFEAGSPPWNIQGLGAGVVTGPGASSGSGYLTMGNVSSASQVAFQTITFPTNLIAASFSFAFEVFTSDPNSSEDSLLTLYITDTNLQNVITTIGSASNLSPTAGYLLGGTNLAVYTVQTNLSPYAGRSVDIYFTAASVPGSGAQTTYNIDSVSMLIGTTADIPANDNFTNRAVLSISSPTVSAATFCASKEPHEPAHAGNSGGHSVWWSWTPTTNGIASLNTTNSTFTTLLAVYTGSSLTNLVKVASDNGSGEGNGTGRVKFPFSAGTEYQIAVDGNNGAWGTAVLNLSFTLDATAPTVTISSPAAGADSTNASLLVKGTASDNVRVAQVQYSLKNAAGTNAFQPATGTSNWTATVTNLIPGSNTVSVQAMDTSGNLSPIVSRIFNYIVNSPLSLTINGGGTVTGATNGQPLSLAESHTITAKASPGFKFVNWTGSVTTTNPTLTFIMTSNLTFTANFMDITAPTLTVVTPKAGLNVSNANFTASGTAKDNVGVANVLWRLNGSDWQLATTGNNWTNWTANMTLVPGTNKFAAFAMDAAGNPSPTNTISFVYVLSATLSVATNGNGTVTPNDNGAFLAIGKNYSLTAKAGIGFKFVNWTGSQTTNNPVLTFTMASNLNFTANFKDATAPTLTVTTPKAGLNVSNATFNASGTAKDNVAVADVSWQLNGSGWQPASTANNWTNWTANMTLVPGTNKFMAYAADAAGNLSTTNSISFVYVLSTTLSVTTNGNGSVSPNDNGALLQIGKSYSLTAKAGTGFKFINWTGSETTTNPVLTFLMASNLNFTANFKDATAPLLTITAPKANQSISNAAGFSMFMASGTAKDNVAVTNVFYQFNGGDWNAAKTFNSFSNWNAIVSLNAGTNRLKAYAADAAGNLSTTSSVTFVFVVLPDWAPNSVTGLTDEVTPDPEVDSPYAVNFSETTFSKAGIGTNSANYGVGVYTYIKTGTNSAEIFRTNTAPPDVSNVVTTAELTFTNLHSGMVSNTINGVTGTFKFVSAKDFVPVSVGGKTLTATKSGGNVTVKLGTNDTFVSSSTSGTNSGIYTFTSFSPVGAMLQLNETNAASDGNVNFVELTFTSTAGGDYYLTTFDNLGSPTQVGTNTFTLK